MSTPYRPTDYGDFDDEVIEADLSQYSQMLRENLGAMTISAAAVSLCVMLITLLFITPQFKARALLRPASQEQTSISAALGGGGPLEVGSFLGSSLGQVPYDAQEDQTLMLSYGFTIDLIKQHGLESRLVHRSRWDDRLLRLGFHPYSQWQQYLHLRGMFTCNYDTKTGNLELAVLNSQPEMGLRILGYYIDDLRSLLRARAIEAAERAAKSLSEEVQQTSDPLLQTQLDQLVAQQLQRQKTAQVQADFAFTEVEKPFVPDTSDRPWVFADSFAAGTFVFVVWAAILVARVPARRPYVLNQRQRISAQTNGRHQSAASEPF